MMAPDIQKVIEANKIDPEEIIREARFLRRQTAACILTEEVLHKAKRERGCFSETAVFLRDERSYLEANR
ncbi:MAG: hypothetical protein AAF614_01160 [Chloroflexota bacterium]